MSQLRTSTFLGVSFVAEPPETVVAWLVDTLSSAPTAGLPIHLIPAHALAEAPKDSDFQTALESPGLVIPDGRWLEILTRRLPAPLYQLRGTDLLLRICDEGRQSGISHYFLGSKAGVLGTLREQLESLFPGITVCGSEPYPFGELSPQEKNALSTRVKKSGAQIVWMGISTPRQNKEAVWLAQSAGVVVACVGAALEFVAGEKKVAPLWMQKAGLEWFHRFLSEPRRLWRRYTLGSLDFLRLYLRDLRQRRGVSTN